ncbi:bifunctional DNA primase/polymerase [Rhodanobacter sp. L36]|uniref:bifunctional DNA primase/polymerase n=1 Tax=Rhodanobacter sp. L36 TaxID=1747221 RepID=UPI00131D922A|nr:bifunctional DNA primase/polymerase [Rhodanobacter sp. L36]
MQQRHCAIEAAAAGFRIFPVKENRKEPDVAAWPSVASSDVAKAQDWFAKGNLNYGIYAGERIADGQRRHMVVIDLDVKNGKDGVAEFARICEAHGGLPPTYTTRSGSGGQHVFLYVPHAVANGVDTLASGIDIRGKNGYVLGPGSVVDGNEYTELVQAPIIDCPDWLLSMLKPARVRASNRTALKPDPERAEKSVIEYLKTAERSVKGAGGDQAAYRVAARCLAICADVAMTVDLMLSEHWDEGCGWSADRLAEKVEHAWKYMTSPPGSDSAEAVFEKVEMSNEDVATLHPFDMLNTEWAAVAEPPNTVIYRTRSHQATGQKIFERYTRDGFFGLLANQKFDGSPLAAKWWESPRRKTFEGGTDFAPGGGASENVLNTWGGFAVRDIAGDWSLMRSHIRDVICSGDEKLDRYVMGWLARLVQKPGEPGHVALVLRGGRGTGKGTLGEMLCRIFGAHGMHVANSRRVTGDFNGHLADKVFLFADEAFFAGDRKHEAVLKTLVTERSLDMEQKYQVARNVRNCVHLLIASNDAWVVPAGPFERRFCVIDMGNQRQQDIDYFDSIRKQMDNGGLSAMLHDLLAHDITDFNVWHVPNTGAATEQKTASLRGPERWLYEALAAENIAGNHWGEDPVTVSKAAAYSDYQTKARSLGDFKADHSVSFWKSLTRILAAGGILAKDIRARIGGERELQRILPGLPQARLAFEAHMSMDASAWG